MFGRLIQTKKAEVAFIFGGYNNPTPYTTIQRFTGETISNDSATLSEASIRLSCSCINLNAFLMDPEGLSIQRYNGTTRTTDSATLSTGSSNVNLPSTTLVNDIFIFGGYVNPLYQDKIQRYNGTTRTTDSATLSTTLSDGSSSTLLSNAFFFNGYNSTSPYNYNIIQRYNGTTRTTDSATTLINQSAPYSVTARNYIYLLPQVLQAIQKYDGTTVTTDSATFPWPPFIYGSASDVNNDMYVFGGRPSSVVNTITKYDGTTVTTSAITLTVSCEASGAATIKNGIFI